MLILLLTLPITFYAIEKLSSVTQKLDQIINSNNKKTALIQTMGNILRDRSITIVQMNSVDDPFELDDLQTQMSLYASEFIEARSQLSQLKLTENEKQSLEKVYSVTRTRALEQIETIELFLQHNKFAAMKNYYKKVMPGLSEALTQLNHIKLIQSTNAQEQLDASNQLHSQTRFLIYISSIISLILVLIITIVIIRRILRTEIEKEFAQSILKESLEQINELVDHATDGIMSIDDQQKIILFNPEAEKLFGYKAKEVMGKDMTILIPEYARHNHLNNVHKFRDSQQGHSVHQTVRALALKGLHRDGHIFPAEVGISKHFTNNKWTFTAFIRDVTEQQNIEKALKKSVEIAEQSNQVKTEFLANMSHELRTPMHAILSFSSLGAKKLIPKPFDEKNCSKLLRYFNNINIGGTRLLNLLNDLLDLSKLEAGKTKLHIDKIDLLQVLNLCLAEIHTLIDEKFIKVKINPTEVNTKINVDQKTIHQVFINLLSNAVKFTANTKNINISFLEKDDIKESAYYDKVVKNSLIFKIEDEGIGIPENELHQVFDQFVQSSKTKTGAGGTGLGLAICKKILNAHDGLIWAEHSSNTSGSIFYFSIPRNLKNADNTLSTTKNTND